jgi:hypothetical protein
MVMATDTYNDGILDAAEDQEEDFELLIDEPYLAVVRVGEQVVASAHTPMDLADMSFRLAQAGYMIMEMIAFHDGVIEMLLQPLADITDSAPEGDREIYSHISEYMKEKEKVYG